MLFCIFQGLGVSACTTVVVREEYSDAKCGVPMRLDGLHLKQTVMHRENLTTNKHASIYVNTINTTSYGSMGLGLSAAPNLEIGVVRMCMDWSGER